MSRIARRVRELNSRGASLGVVEGEWPDRAASSATERALFAEFGRMPSGAVSVADERWAFSGRDVPVRVYRATPHPIGVVVMAHGGGFAFGSIHDPVAEATARWRALNVGAIVVDVEYRLAPEHPFPAGVDDLWDVIVRARGECGLPIVVDSVSAGSAMVGGALTELPAGTVAGAVWQIPSVDLRPEAPWLEDLNTGLTRREEVRQFYLHGADPFDRRASPMAAELSRFPPSLVLVAGHDPLRAVGERFTEGLAAAGVPARLVVMEGVTHGAHLMLWRWARARRWQRIADRFCVDVLRRP
ncbi:alpha/beta hydrolase fold domain-containing protein [Agromyces bauzanensis]